MAAHTDALLAILSICAPDRDTQALPTDAGVPAALASMETRITLGSTRCPAPLPGRDGWWLHAAAFEVPR